MYIIFPNDPTTDFMDPVLDAVNNLVIDGSLKVIRCAADDPSYEKARREIQDIPPGSKVVFIGHSTSSMLFGGESVDYPRAALVKKDEMGLFKDRQLFLISCFSAGLMKSSRPFRNKASCLGFGLLPSEIGELGDHGNISKIGLTEEDILSFREILSEVMSYLVAHWLDDGKTLYSTYDLFKVLVNKKINDCLLKENNARLAELLFYISHEAVVE
ncbi:hypothetical protein [Ferrimonas pelagia]|uniref:CHAT domain-containing protein n=1 Tax=Ferrimonas pelagia TaxID=1177826 RepID=A0ABP9E9B2_9GAMM